ncbi:ATP-binding protein [Streptomyces glomeratus]|uniref:ATP-binding protein n=1 Tax=Streptomyces glomeratus TaxID=284452 RepID=A0ABP6LC70_9ACTN|nr:ATP-binding protein [Streptomyces glomeratus]MCF1507009.1 ATP-binding protein [Streptomyces glomeratus]
MNDYIPPAPLEPRPTRYRMRLTVGEHSARHIRRVIRSFLHEWEMAELSEAAELAVSELVANVVRHVPDRRCALLVQRRAAGVRVEVTDGFAGLPSARREVPEDAEGGRGLVLLDAVVDKWGVEREPSGGKTVWFECLAPR